MSWHKLGNNFSKESVKKLAYDKIISKQADSFKDIISAKIEEGIQYRFVSTKSFNPLNVLKFIDNHYEVEELFLVVYRMNLKAVNFLKNFIENKKTPTTILLSSFFKENKKYERWCKELIDFAASSKQQAASSKQQAASSKQISNFNLHMLKYFYVKQNAESI